MLVEEVVMANKHLMYLFSMTLSSFLIKNTRLLLAAKFESFCAGSQSFSFSVRRTRTSGASFAFFCLELGDFPAAESEAQVHSPETVRFLILWILFWFWWVNEVQESSFECGNRVG